MVINKTTLEWILIASIGAILVFTFADFSGKSTKKEVIIDESAYEAYPLTAWKDTHEKWNGKQGDILKIKYRVFNDDTFIQVVNNEGVIVHTQPYQRSPRDDGSPRDFTYTWTLYYTQDYGDEIPPGEYEIQVCYRYSRNVDLSILITI